MVKLSKTLKSRSGAVNGLVVGAIIITVLIIAAFVVMTGVGQETLVENNEAGVEMTATSMTRLVDSVN
jgi:hypothetical protein